MPSGTNVKPAIRTREPGESDMPEAMVAPGSAIRTAGFERPLARQDAGKSNAPSVRSASGMRVFGPQANEVARTLDEAAGSEPGRSSSGIDITPESAVQEPGSLMYFGPDKDRLQKQGSEPATTEVVKPRKLTQPADMPIPIN